MSLSRLLFFIVFYSFLTFADSVNIPLKTVKKPAADLSYQGRKIDPSAAAELASKQIDISYLNPSDNKFWQDKVYDIKDPSLANFPQGSTGVNFQATEAVINELLTVTMRVQDAKSPDRFYRMALSR